MSTPVIAAVITTCNSEMHLGATLDSISRQTLVPDLLLAIDDQSGDTTRPMLLDSGFIVEAATSTHRNSTTRIAQNFVQGVREATRRGADLVILGDHDDLWRGDRVEHQSALLTANPNAAMVASDGFLIDEHGSAIPGTIRGTFPIPDDFAHWSPSRQMRYALRHSLATGGASSLQPAALDDWSVPQGWLHDRWWSLVSLRAGTLLIDPTPVVDYRISDLQHTGLNDADQHSRSRWVLGKSKDAARTAKKVLDLNRLRFR